jgi:hypothetical protein
VLRSGAQDSCPSSATGRDRLPEHAVEHDEVAVRVDVEGRAEAVEEADGSELGVRRRAGACAPERGGGRFLSGTTKLKSLGRYSLPVGLEPR